MYPVEWDADSVSRKYKDVACYIYVVNEKKEYIGVITGCTPQMLPGDSNEAPSTIITYVILDENTNKFAVALVGCVVTQTTTKPSTKHPEIKLRPLSIKPRLIQSQSSKNLFMINRKLIKSYKAGISAENFGSINFVVDKPEHMDLSNVLGKYEYHEQPDIEIVDSVIFVVRDSIMVYDTQVGFKKGEEAKIQNPIMRKLLSERVPAWKIQSW